MIIQRIAESGQNVSSWPIELSQVRFH